VSLHPEPRVNDPGSQSPVLAFINRLWSIRILRFFVIGAINTLFSYLVYAGLVLLGMHYWLATLISTVLGVIFNFFTTGRIVFRSLDNRRFVRFVLVYAFTYIVNILLLRWLVDGLGMDKLLAGALVTLPVALLSYYLNAIWTFKNISGKGEGDD
jgi:putative flippase GtrA